MTIKYNTIGPDGLWGTYRDVAMDPEIVIAREAGDFSVNNLNRKVVEVICGPRQSGKTTLLHLLMSRLLNEGVPAEDIRYVNLDTLPDYEMFKDPVRFYHTLRADNERKRRGRIYLILDEIQRLPNPGLFLKAIHDSYPDVKMIVSGSASLEMKAKTKEFLTGRKRETQLLPLSFREIIRHSGKLPEKVFSERLTPGTLGRWLEYEKTYGRFLKEAMMNMVIYGGYPAVFTSRDTVTKKEVLYELYNSYVKKDITDFMKVENVSQFNNLVKVLAAQSGGLVNVSQICSIIGGNRVTVGKYLNILEETYVIKQLDPLVGNRKNEVKYATKSYFYDCGLRNLALAQFEKTTTRPDFGALIENTVVTESIKTLGLLDEIHYWRTRSGAEVDIVISSGGKPIPVEVKYLSAAIGTLSKSYHSFLEKHYPDRGIFLNRDRFGCVKRNNAGIFYIPVHWFLLRGVHLIEPG